MQRLWSVEKHSFSFSWHQEYTKFLNHKRGNLNTLQPLIKAKAISKGIPGKAAGSGLSLAHLVLAFQRGGVEALSKVQQQGTCHWEKANNTANVYLLMCNLPSLFLHLEKKCLIKINFPWCTRS